MVDFLSDDEFNKLFGADVKSSAPESETQPTEEAVLLRPTQGAVTPTATGGALSDDEFNKLFGEISVKKEEAGPSLFDNFMTVPRGVASALPAFNQGVYGIGAGVAGLLGQEPAKDWFMEQAQKSSDLAEYVAGKPTSWLGSMVTGASQSVGLMAPGIVATGLSGGTAGPAVFLAYAVPGAVTQGGQSVEKALKQGVDPAKALFYGSLDATAEILFEKMPVARLLKDLNVDASFGKLLVNQLAQEVPSEVATTLFQNLNEYATLNPDKPIKEFLDEQPKAVVDTIVQTIMATGGVSTAAYVANKIRTGKGTEEEGGEAPPNRTKPEAITESGPSEAEKAAITDTSSVAAPPVTAADVVDPATKAAITETETPPQKSVVERAEEIIRAKRATQAIPTEEAATQEEAAKTSTVTEAVTPPAGGSAPTAAPEAMPPVTPAPTATGAVSADTGISPEQKAAISEVPATEAATPPVAPVAEAPVEPSTVPERPETIVEQVKALRDFKNPRKAVLITNENIASGGFEIPTGKQIRSLVLPEGVLYWSANKTGSLGSAGAKTLYKAGNLGKFLGLGDFNKQDVAQSAAAGSPPTAIVERTPSGTEVRTAASTEELAPDVRAGMQETITPGNVITEETPEQVIAGRTAPAAPAPVTAPVIEETEEPFTEEERETQEEAAQKDVTAPTRDFVVSRTRRKIESPAQRIMRERRELDARLGEKTREAKERAEAAKKARDEAEAAKKRKMLKSESAADKEEQAYIDEMYRDVAEKEQAAAKEVKAAAKEAQRIAEVSEKREAFVERKFETGSAEQEARFAASSGKISGDDRAAAMTRADIAREVFDEVVPDPKALGEITMPRLDGIGASTAFDELKELSNTLNRAITAASNRLSAAASAMTKKNGKLSTMQKGFFSLPKRTGYGSVPGHVVWLAEAKRLADLIDYTSDRAQPQTIAKRAMEANAFIANTMSLANGDSSLLRESRKEAGEEFGKGKKKKGKKQTPKRAESEDVEETLEAKTPDVLPENVKLSEAPKEAPKEAPEGEEKPEEKPKGLKETDPERFARMKAEIEARINGTAAPAPKSEANLKTNRDDIELAKKLKDELEARKAAKEEVKSSEVNSDFKEEADKAVEKAKEDNTFLNEKQTEALEEHHIDKRIEEEVGIANKGEPKTFEEAVKFYSTGAGIVDWMSRNATNESDRVIAERIKPVLDNTSFFLVGTGDTLPLMVASRLSDGSHAIYYTKNNERLLVVHRDRLDEEAVMHELIHAATMTRIIQGNLMVNGKLAHPELAPIVKELMEIRDALTKEFKRRIAENPNDPIATSPRVRDAATNVLELPTYAMTNDQVREFMRSVPFKGKDVWSKFVDTIRRLLGIPKSESTALTAILDATDRLMDIEHGVDTKPFTGISRGPETSKFNKELAASFNSRIKAEDKMRARLDEDLTNGKVRASETVFPIRDEDVTERGTIESFAKQFGKDRFERMLSLRLTDKIDIKLRKVLAPKLISKLSQLAGDVEVLIVNDKAYDLNDDTQSSGYFDTATNKIYIPERTATSTEKLAHVFAHEAAHAAFHYAIDESAELRAQLERALSIAQSRWEFENQNADRSLYAFRDVHEFVSEAWSNTRFQRFLAETPIDKSDYKALGLNKTIAGQIRTLWDFVRRQVAEVLDLPMVFKSQGYPAHSRSLLDAVMKTSEALMEISPEARARQKARPQGGIRLLRSERRPLSEDFTARGFSEDEAKALADMIESEFGGKITDEEVDAISRAFATPITSDQHMVDALTPMAGRRAPAITREIKNGERSNLRKWFLRRMTLDYARQLYNGAFETKDGNAFDDFVFAIQQRDAIAENVAEKHTKDALEFMELARKNPIEAEEMASVAMDATRYNLNLGDDADNTHLGKNAKRGLQAKKRFAELNDRYNNLLPETRELFDSMVENFRASHNEGKRLLVNNALDSLDMPMSDATRKVLVDKVLEGSLKDEDVALVNGDKSVFSSLRNAQELRAIKGTYFPQMRHGDIMIVTKEKIAVPKVGPITVGGKSVPVNVSVNGNVVSFSANDDTRGVKSALDEIVDKYVSEHDLQSLRYSKKFKDRATGEIVEEGDTLTDHDYDLNYEVELQTKGVHFFESEKEAKEFKKSEDARMASTDELEDVSQILDRRTSTDRASIINDVSIAAVLKKVASNPNFSDTQKQAMKDALESAIISQMPGNRASARYQARRNVLGASKDIGRAAFIYGQSQGHFQATLSTAPQVRDARKRMEETATNVRDGMGPLRREVVNELDERMKTLDESGVSNKAVRYLTTVAFLDKLFSPMNSIINSTQPLLNTLPVLGGQYGNIRAGAAIMSAYGKMGVVGTVGRGIGNTANAMANFAKSGLDTTDIVGSIRKKLGPKYAPLIDHLIKQGAISNNVSLEIASAVAEGSDVIGTTLSRMERVARQLPTAIELVNRVVTAVANYDLAISSGKSTEIAVQESFDNVMMTQGDNRASNTPTFMKHGILSLAMQFRKFALLQTQLYADMYMRVTSKNSTPRDRMIAAKQLSTMMILQAMVAGPLSVPGIELLKVAVSLLAWVTGGDDWEDRENQLRAWTAQMIHDFAGANPQDSARWASLLNGGVLTRLMGVDMKGRMDQSNLWTGFAPDNMNRKSIVEYVGNFFLGAGGSTGLDWIDGIKKIGEGVANWGTDKSVDSFAAAAEKLIPIKTIADLIKGGRRIASGEYDTVAAIIQTLGATPETKTAADEVTSAVKSEKKVFTKKATDLRAKFMEADTPYAQMKIISEIRDYNSGITKDSGLSKIDIDALKKKAREAE